MKKPFSFSSVIAVMVVSDTSSAPRSSFSPVSRYVCGEVVCEFETPRLIVKLTARKHYDCRPKRPVRYTFPAIIQPREPPVNCGWIGIERTSRQYDCDECSIANALNGNRSRQVFRGGFDAFRRVA